MGPRGWFNSMNPRHFLPDLALLETHHGLPFAAAEGRPEFRHIGDDAVHPERVRRMGIRNRVEAFIFRALVAAGPLRHADKEALVRREALDGFQILTFRRVLPGHIRQESPAQIGDVLAERELAVDLDVVDNRKSRVLVGNAFRALLELLRVLSGPPVLQVAFGVELPPLVVETMGQLVPDGRAGIAVVGRVVGVRMNSGGCSTPAGKLMSFICGS